MAVEQEADERIPAPPSTRRTVTRRGLVAGAAALVVGILAKQSATTVRAVNGNGNGGSLVIGANVFSGNSSNTSSQPTQLINGAPPAYNPTSGTAAIFQGATGGGNIGVIGTADSYVFPNGTVLLNDGGTGVYGRSAAGIGVHGTSAASPVAGFNGGVGVLGETSNPGAFAVKGVAYAGNSTGVYGSGTTGVYAEGYPYGVTGISYSSSGVGVTGQCDAAFGVGVLAKSGSFVGLWGQTDSGTAILGDVKAGAPGASNSGVQGRVGYFGANSQNNTIGVGGYNASTGLNPIGVYGNSTHGNGVSGVTSGVGGVAGLYGTSSTAYGIIGNTTAAGYSGLTAITSTAGVAALAATSTSTGAYAAYFQGTTVVQGDFFVVSGVKSAAVPHADGSHRAVYCVESPESWFEDFGEGKLAGGKADIKLDPDFASIVRTDAYHVFLTPSDAANKGMAVTAKRGDGFLVQELHGGASSGTFSYRVVAKRKDIEGKRLAKVDLLKIITPDPAKLPKPPEPPRKQ